MRALAGFMLTLLTAGSPLAVRAEDSTLRHDVAEGDRLELRSFSGSVEIQVGGGDEVVVTALHASRDEIVIERRGTTLLVVPRSWKRDSGSFAIDLPDMARVRVEGPSPDPTELQVRVPSWLPVTVESPYSDVRIDGLQAAVEVVVLSGSVEVRDTRGSVLLQSMSGEILLEDADGRLTLEGAHKRIHVRNSSGDLRVETTVGPIELDGLDTERIVAASVDGDIVYRGSFPPGSRTELFTHSGDVQLVLPGVPDARFNVRAFRGRLQTDLELPEGATAQRAEFTSGDGSARVELQSFTGDVIVRREADP